MKKKDKEYVVFTDDEGIYNQAKQMDYDDIFYYTSLGQLQQTDKVIVFLYYLSDYDTKSYFDKHNEMREANNNIKFINISNGDYNYEQSLSEMYSQKDIERVLINDGCIHETSTRNRCGNCHAKLIKGSEYCYVCGTKRGEGKFEPFYNALTCVYGPPILQVITCKQCGNKFEINSLGGENAEYCTKCGSDQLIVDEKAYPYFDEDE